MEQSNCVSSQNGTMVLSSERVVLRPCAADDADAVFAAQTESIDQLRAWFSWCHSVRRREDCVAWARSRPEAWARGEEYSFVVSDRTRNEVLGCVWLNPADRHGATASLAYWVRPSCSGMGIATEAAGLAVQWGLDVLRFQRIELSIAVANAGSRRVAEKLGAVFEGIARHRLLVHDKIMDAAVYSILPGELRLCIR